MGGLSQKGLLRLPSDLGTLALKIEIQNCYDRKVSLNLVCYCSLKHSTSIQLIAYSFHQVPFSNAQSNFSLIPNIYNIPTSGGRIKI